MAVILADIRTRPEVWEGATAKSDGGLDCDATNINWIQGKKGPNNFKELFDRGGLDLDDAINKNE